MATDSQIIATARAYLGTPFLHMGRSTAGIDCAGLVVCVSRDLGLPVKDLPRYGRQPLGGMLDKIVRQSFDVTTELSPGTILSMRFAREPQHLAIYTGENVIHCYERVGKCIEHRLDSTWRKRIVHKYRFRGAPT